MNRALLSTVILLVPSIAPLSVQGSCHDRDEDRDGVNSCDDRCPSTTPGTAVDSTGCPCGELDEDGDGVTNCADRCPGRDDALDSDGDAVPDCLDACSDTEVGGTVDPDGCLATFINWESPHVHPLDLTPDGSLLLAVNTADNRLEIFDTRGLYLRGAGSIPVGLDPVTVRARSDGEAWVVNRISDTISIVDLAARNVTATLRTGNEPADVVFAGEPPRAFVSISGLNLIEVYDLGDLSTSPAIVSILGESPRALATDGSSVYAAIFESGNATTIIPREVVSAPDSPYGGVNPPPNSGDAFLPAGRDSLPPPPQAGLVVRRDASGRWFDDNGHDWSSNVAWDVHDHDVAMVNASTLEVQYAGGWMNACMTLCLRPDGMLSVAGTDATNQIRFEPNLKGIFLRVKIALFHPDSPERAEIVDLNPHLTYARPTVFQSERDESIGDPRAIIWDTASSRGFVSGMGSNTVVVIDAHGRRLGRIDVGRGPTGMVLDASGERLYVIDKFEGAVSVVDTALLLEVHRAPFFDPTPEEIRKGRRHFYDTHKGSGLGQAACASCHIDTRTDRLVWDLGNPAGEMKRFNQPCSGDTHPCQDWHPMKGPLATQTLVGAIGTEPFHWRGDREDLSAFNPAFQMLLGDDTRLSDPEMTDLRSFLGTLRPPPNPYRNFDGSVKTTHANGGNPARGEALFHSPELNCASCHAQSTGSKPTIVAAGLLLEPQGLKVPQLQTLYQKTGFNKDAATSLAGFGFTHDGSEDTIAGLLLGRGIDHSQRAAVQFRGEHAADDVRDLEAFLLSFSSATHPAMGVQTTVAEAPVTPAQEEMVSEMIRIAATGAAGLIVKGKEENLSRGYVYALDGLFQSDRAAERLTAGELLAKAGRGSEMTFTVVPYGSRIRMGIDRDSDGVLDQDEVDACGGEGAFNPQDTTAANECEPGSPFFPFQRGDANADRRIDLSDAVAILQALFLGGFLACADAADTNDDGEGNISDPISILNHLFLGGPAPPPPFTVCGPDFTEDALGCGAYASCASAAETFTSSVGLEVVEIRPGSFLMGSPLDEEDRDIDEALHRVTITRALWIGLTEVTQAQYRAVTGFDPSRFNDCPSCPVTDVTWAEATEFCRQLTLRDRSSGLIGEEDRYRLPTEAEWEYACRAGTVSRFHFGDAPLCELLPCGGACEHASPYAWWCENSGARPHPVAQKLPNAWGLYDMHGNVFEWCSDWYGPYAEGDAADPEGPAFSSYKVMRGGAFLDPLRSHRSAGRQAGTAGASQPTVGFRAVLEKG